MADAHKNFPRPVQRQALERQKYLCACCEVSIAAIGEEGVDQHRFGEGAQAHHVIPHKEDGPLWMSNCVVICRSCHSSAHQGGRWGNVEIYADLKGMTMEQKIAKVSALYPHYNG